MKLTFKVGVIVSWNLYFVAVCKVAHEFAFVLSRLCLIILLVNEANEAFTVGLRSRICTAAKKRKFKSSFPFEL